MGVRHGDVRREGLMKENKRHVDKMPTIQVDRRSIGIACTDNFNTEIFCGIILSSGSHRHRRSSGGPACSGPGEKVCIYLLFMQ